MAPERWRRIEDLYHSARQTPSSARDSYLSEACGGNDELYRKVISLLAHNAGAPAILDHPAWEAARGFIDSTTSVFAPGTRIGPYQIEALLGRGGMGIVYRAVDTRLNRRVALKIAKESFEGRFTREAQAVSALNHTHVCTLYDVGPNYLVMELVEGETLHERLKRGPLPMEQLWLSGAQIASALAAAHSLGIIHRDLKPANVMLTKTGIKVLDFGLAKFAAHSTATLTPRLGVIGTPAYMAPEQMEGKDADSRTDIFALGLLLYEMVTGKRLIQGEPAQWSGFPGSFAHIVERCIAREPDDRWQSASDIRAELDWASRSLDTRQPAKVRFWFAASVLGTLVVALFLYFSLRTTVGPSLVTFQITSSAVSNSTTVPVISPDGRKVAFRETGADSRVGLWLHLLARSSTSNRPAGILAFA
jgi:eukaryotic-like serine/threonine-protein kinase